MREKSSLRFKKYVVLFSTIFCSYQFSYAQETEYEELPFDAVIQSTLKGKRYKFYGNTRFNFNQAYFSNWISRVYEKSKLRLSKAAIVSETSSNSFTAASEVWAKPLCIANRIKVYSKIFLIRFHH